MSLQTRLEAFINAVGADMKARVTLDTPQVVTGIKQFGPGALLMRNADGSVTAEPYSDVNAPTALERTLATTPGAPVAGNAVEWTTDGKSLDMRASDGTVTRIGPGTGQGGAPPVSVYKIAADRLYSTVTLADITDWVVPLPANSVVSIDAILVLSSAATTTGWQFNAITRNTTNTATLTPSRFLMTYEYQSSVTAWTSQTQTVHTTPPTLITAAYVANAGIMCRILGQIEIGATAGELRLQMRSEIAGSAITLRRGSSLRVM